MPFSGLHWMRWHYHRCSAFLRPFSKPDYEWNSTAVVRSRAQPAERADAFSARGYHKRHFFPHSIHVLPKVAPDGFKFSSWMSGAGNLRQLWQVALFALDPVRSDFPADLYADTEVNWHMQQFGRNGHVATACIRVTADSLHVLNMHSDLVQRASRRPELRTKVDARFNGWPRMMVHALVAYALELGLRRVYLPSSTLAMEHTDRHRQVRPAMFERVYDRAARHHFAVIEDGRWWRIELVSQRDRIIPFTSQQETVARGRTISVLHDLERGLGHRSVHPEFSRSADVTAPAALTEMLAIERQLGVRATYNVVGCLMNEVRGAIEQDGHCLAFHSFDHGAGPDQLGACRRVDYRIKGYRPPRSRITRELRVSRLAWHDVEWLASGRSSLGVHVPTLVDRVVRIPVLFDDIELHRGRQTFEAWSRQALETIQRNDFVAFGLHDCYASHWLPHYARFLEEVKQLGSFRTLDEVAADVFLSAGV